MGENPLDLQNEGNVKLISELNTRGVKCDVDIKAKEIRVGED